jgi:hypothetical protein
MFEILGQRLVVRLVGVVVEHGDLLREPYGHIGADTLPDWVAVLPERLDPLDPAALLWRFIHHPQQERVTVNEILDDPAPGR